MADNSVQISIEMETLQATKDLKKFQEQSTKSISTIEDTFSSLKTAAVAAIAVFASAKVVGFFNDIITAASESDQAIQQLNVALASTGEFSQEASQGIQDYATELQKTTGITDEAVLSAFSLAKSFGITNQQAQELTSAAVDLAAATGKDLDTAVQQLGATYSGTAGKLSKLGPEFKNLTEQQLKSGEAVRLVGQRFEGTAAALTDTFAGAVRQAKNAYDDLFETLGASITQNTVVIASIKQFSKAFDLIGVALKNNEKEFGQFIADTIKLFFNVMPQAVRVLIGFNDVIEFFTRGIVFAYTAIQQVVGDLVTLVIGFKDGKEAADAFNKAITEQNTKTLEKTNKFFQDTEDTLYSIGNLAVSAAENVNKTNFALDKTAKGIKNNENNTKDLVKANEDLKGSYEKIKGALDGIVNENNKLTKSKKELIAIDFEAGLQSLKNAQLELLSQGKTREEVEKLTEAYRAAIVEKQKLANERLTVGDLNLGELVGPEFSKQLSESIKKVNFGDLAKGAAGVFDAALSGSDGAKKLVAGLGGKIADSIIPGLGPIAESIFGKLAAGKEQAKQFVTEFVDAIPDIVIAITEALPDALIRLFEKVLSTEFLIKLGGAIGRGMIKVLTGGTLGKDIGTKIANEFKNIVKNLGSTFAQQFMSGVSTFGQQIYQAFADAGQALISSINTGFSQGISSIGPKVSEAFTNAVTIFAQSIKNVFNDVFTKLKQAIIDGATDAAKELKEKLTKAGEAIRDEFYKPVERLIKFLDGFKIDVNTPGSGGGNGTINKINEYLGPRIGGGSGPQAPIRFATGGIVPAGYPNDTFPARLTSGELVVPRDMVQQLGAFLNNSPQQSSGSSDVQTALLAKIANLLQQPINAQTSVNVNQKALADIILKLNRNNARLTA